MTQERLTMKKIKEILRLKYEAGLSNRAIAGACNISNSTVGEYLRRAKAAGVSWPLGELNEDELYQKLFGEKEVLPEKAKPLPDWEAVRKELRQKGVTLHLIWIEYIEKHPDGYQHSQFGEYYRRWTKAHGEPSKRNVHVGGERMQVDYAGLKISMVNPETGETSQVPVFVAVLPASNYTYAEAQSSENQCSWNNGHVRAIEFFGGVVRIIVPDNLKTGITKPNYYEPDINPAYQELAEHYQFAVLPTRIKKPKDKGKVENGVQNVERWVIAPLRKRTFFSLAALNQAIREQLDQLNNKVMLAVGRSRRAEFEDIDQPNLRPLPEKPYEYAVRKTTRVNIDYHVDFEKHLYSVPFTLIHEEVRIRASERMVEIYHSSQREPVAVHPRSNVPGRYSTQTAHMPSKHQKAGEWTEERLVRWASEIGPHTSQLIQSILSSRQHPEQAFRSCLGILRLSGQYAHPLMESACQEAYQDKTLNYRGVKAVLERLQPVSTSQTPPLPSHENIRSNSYYQ
jgi:transposase